VLTLTSHANRTSPVLRGKWVMEVRWRAAPAPAAQRAGLEKTRYAKTAVY
jgi:hypothetical protein